MLLLPVPKFLNHKEKQMLLCLVIENSQQLNIKFNNYFKKIFNF